MDSGDPAVRRLPLIILAGGDQRPADLPAGAEASHPLRGLKGIDIRLDGRPLVDHVVEHFLHSGLFGPIFVGGPVAVYGERRGEATVIDTAGSFGTNIETTIAHVHAEISGALAMTTCDILPTARDTERLMREYFSRAPLDFWLPLAVVPDDPEELGASQWKPRYRIRPATGGAACETLPAHLVIANPKVVHLGLLYRSLELAYRSRNHQVLPRLWTIASGLLAWLLARDAAVLLRGRLPFGTLRTLYHGTLAAVRLHAGTIRADELAARLDHLFVDRRHRRRHPDLRGRVDLVVDALSFAKDIDTFEEAWEAGVRTEGVASSPESHGDPAATDQGRGGRSQTSKR